VELRIYFIIINIVKIGYFFPKIILLDSGDYTPQTDIMTLYKGGYGGEGAPYGG
jgi:hypothetical protein